MAENNQIIELYTRLAEDPKQDFGWEKGLDNAKAHGYKQEWLEIISDDVWAYCAAVGNPFNIAEISKGDTVLDLGCGAGVDLLVASLLVGDEGRVYGVDITPKMVETAQRHALSHKHDNIEVIECSFDETGLEDESVDVVISNGAINLTSCKESVFAEIYRVLRVGGNIYFSDMIDVSETACCSIERNSCSKESSDNDWANCVAGTMREDELIELIQKAGFKEVICTGHTHYSTAETTVGATFKATKIAAEVMREKHWDGIFQNADYTKVLWHQNSPQKSLETIQKHVTKDAQIIDAGCGASFLVDRLLENSYKNITLLDISKTSLDIVKDRINNDTVVYACCDILNFDTEQKFGLWHDRAVFHFLQTQKERDAYFEIVDQSLNANGIALISTFAVNGERQCAGLDVVQYDTAKMREMLPQGLNLISVENYDHITPRDTIQKYTMFIIQKK